MLLHACAFKASTRSSPISSMIAFYKYFIVFGDRFFYSKVDKIPRRVALALSLRMVGPMKKNEKMLHQFDLR